MPAALVLAFLLIPILEIYTIVQVGQEIGAGWTILLLIADSVAGAWLVKREGRRAWSALQQSLGSGRMPTKELADGALVLVGGTLLLTPGFFTDVVGFFFLLPFTRPIARRLLIAFVQRRVERALVAQPGLGPMGGGPMPGFPKPAPARGGRVVQGEVADDGPRDDEKPGR